MSTGGATGARPTTLAHWMPAASNPAAPAPRWLYLHGFASSRDSAKGRALEAHYAGLGIALERLDLRRPSLEHLRLSAVLAHVRERIGGEHDRAVLLGSSLGGLRACRAASGTCASSRSTTATS